MKKFQTLFLLMATTVFTMGAGDCGGTNPVIEADPVISEIELWAPYPVLDSEGQQTIYREKEVRIKGSNLMLPGTDTQNPEVFNRDVQVFMRWSKLHNRGQALHSTDWQQLPILSLSDSYIDVLSPEITHSGTVEFLVRVMVRGDSKPVSVVISDEFKAEPVPLITHYTVHGDDVGSHEDDVAEYGEVTVIGFNGDDLVPADATGFNVSEKSIVQWRQVSPSVTGWRTAWHHSGWSSSYREINFIPRPDRDPAVPGIVEFRIYQPGIGYSNVVPVIVR